MPPHVLVMTATPIPRTLAMTLYGDLDVSVIDEMPPGRIPIKTMHKFDTKRSEVFSFIKRELEKGRQAYVIYPFIEESENSDIENLIHGYEEVQKTFPANTIGMMHGRIKFAERERTMKLFAKTKSRYLLRLL